MTGRPKKRVVRTFISQRRKGLWRVFEAAIALFCLLVTHQSVWVYFQDLSERLRQSYPNPTVWITPASFTEPIDPQIYPKPSFQVKQQRLALRGFAPPNQPVNLIINGIAAGSDFSYDGKLNFYDVELRRGANEITAYLWDPARQASLSANETSSPQIIYYQPAQPLPPGSWARCVTMTAASLFSAWPIRSRAFSFMMNAIRIRWRLWWTQPVFLNIDLDKCRKRLSSYTRWRPQAVQNKLCKLCKIRF